MSAHRSGLAVLPFAPALCLALCGVLSGGCSAPQTRTVSLPQPASDAASRSQANARANRALEDLASAVKTWSKTPSSSGARPTATAKSLVYINVAVLARQHPAWRLADALEREDFTQDSKPADRFSASGVALAPIRFAPDVRISSVAPDSVRSSFSPPGESSFVLTPPITRWEPTGIAPKRIEATALPRALDVARRRQDNAFLAFLNDAAFRQKDARFDAAETQRMALDAQIDAERHAPLDELSPSLLDDPIALELTNLKLRLLTASLEAQPALLRRIAALEAPWQARLREQEKARERELRELRRTRPFRLEREGNARIAAFLKATQRDDTALRTNLRDTHRALVNADFAPNNAILGIALPDATPSLARRAPFQKPVSSPQKQMSVETFAQTRSSQRAEIAALPALNAFGSAFDVALPASFAARPNQTTARQKARQLRLQALRESQLRAQAMARRNGWTLVGRAPKVRDETRRAMRFLNMR